MNNQPTQEPQFHETFERPKLSTGMEQEWHEALALKHKIDSARKTSLLRDERNAKLNAYISIPCLIFVIVFACLI